MVFHFKKKDIITIFGRFFTSWEPRDSYTHSRGKHKSKEREINEGDLWQNKSEEF